MNFLKANDAMSLKYMQFVVQNLNHTPNIVGYLWGERLKDEKRKKVA